MYNEKRETINEVVLQGGVAYKYSTESVTILTLAIGAKESKNFPRAVFFGDAKKEADKFQKGDFVKISGNIQSSKKIPKIKNQETESIFGETIEKAKSSMEENFEVEGSFVSYKNEIKVAGTVVAAECLNGDIYNITIRTNKNDRLSFVKLTRYIRTKDDPIFSVLIGDYVYVIGVIQTAKKEKDGSPYTFQNFIVSEIKKG